MKPISYARQRFPADVIRQAVWLYFRFAPSFRDVEDLRAERGIDISYESIRCWTRKFGRLFARNLRRTRPGPTGRWHLDDMLVRKRRNKQAALRLPRKLLRRQGIHPEPIVTDGLASSRQQHTNRAVVIVTTPAGCGKTIGPRIRICRSGAGRESNSASNHRVQPRGFSPLTPLFTTPSMSNVI